MIGHVPRNKPLSANAYIGREMPLDYVKDTFFPTTQNLFLIDLLKS